jgi:hypothetical protein
MPILPESDPLWQNLPRSVDVLLPDIPEIASDAGNAPVFTVAQGKYTARAAEIFQLSSQLALGNLVATVGMPSKAAFDIILESMKIDVRSDFTKMLREGGRNLVEAWKSIQDGGETGQAIADASVDTAVGAGVNFASAIPVAGWIVKVLWNLGKAINGIIQLAKESENPAVIYPPTVFNPQLDNITVNAVLEDIFGKRDWSRRWGPPSMGQGVGTLPDYVVMSLEGGGFELVRKSGYAEGGGAPIDWGSAGWLGMIPGAPYLHQGIQYRNDKVQDLGEILLPSARNVLLWMWGTVLGHKSNVTPAMWCVDSSVLQSWSGYIHDLHVFIYEDLDASQSVKQKIIDHFNKRGSQRVFGWGSSIKPANNEWEKYLPVQQANTLRERQMGFLDTLMCAYVDDSYVAIKQDEAMRSRWDQRRRQLLEHPARCDVDLTNVPDSDYRTALIDSGAKAGQCDVASYSFAAREFEPPKRVPPGSGYAPPNPRGKPKRKLPAVVPFVAVGGALFAAYKAGFLPTGKLPKLKL